MDSSLSLRGLERLPSGEPAGQDRGYGAGAVREFGMARGGDEDSILPIEFPEEQERSSGSEEEDVSEVERPGGYCKVVVGEKFKAGRYTALEKVGWGHFSTVWLCHDWVKNAVVSIKFQKSARSYTEAAKDEIVFLREVRRRGGRDWPIVGLLDHFEHYGPSGKHVCLVFEVLGKSLLSLIKRFNYEGVPLPLVRRISKQVLEGLKFLHTRCGIIHTDLKPENVLIVPMRHNLKALKHDAAQSARDLNISRFLDPVAMSSRPLSKNQKKRLKAKARRTVASDVLMSAKEGRVSKVVSSSPSRSESGSVQAFQEAANGPKTSTDCPSILKQINTDQAFARGVVKLVDMGSALWTDRHDDPEIQTRQYRSPEVILRTSYDSAVDIWSAACLVFELATGEYLFDPHRDRDYSRDEDHLAHMIETLGPMPKYFALSGRYSREYFNRYGELRRIRRLSFWPLKELLVEKYHFSEKDSELLSSFLLPMLRFDPDRRASAEECLSHPFVADEENYRGSYR